MLRGIEFKSDRFNQEDEWNFLYELTNNTIILCNSTTIKRELTKEIKNTLNEQAEYNDYDCDEEDIRNCDTLIEFLPTTIFKIGEQTILFSVETTCVFKANDVHDIWFCYEDENTNKISLEPLAIVKNSEEKWDDDIIKVYKDIYNGKYGTYNGDYLK